MEYYAAVTMLKQMFEKALIDKSDYEALEVIYAKKYMPQLRYCEPGLISVEKRRG